ncbi:hypothetical protein [Rhizobium vallis]|uniref:hypothetical protein n=1 Tax=Rhizobium vallis TaxID=634290 RepID=UPI0013DFEB8A|nr:hypothetical protein [Rhizobium vallis]
MALPLFYLFALSAFAGIALETIQRIGKLQPKIMGRRRDGARILVGDPRWEIDLGRPESRQHPAKFRSLVRELVGTLLPQHRAECCHGQIEIPLQLPERATVLLPHASLEISERKSRHRPIEIGQIIVDRYDQFVEHGRRTAKIRIGVIGIHSPRQVPAHDGSDQCRKLSAESGFLISEIGYRAVRCLDHARAASV